MGNLEMFAVRLDSQVKQELKVMSVIKKVTMQELFNEIVESYLEQEKKEGQ